VLSPTELLDDRQHQARGFLSPNGMPRLPFLLDGAAPNWTAEGPHHAA
jgi:hypothetical protein